MTDSSRELVRPDSTAAAAFESYPRFIKRGFENYEGLGIKGSTADSKHVPSHGRGCWETTSLSLPQKVVEFLKLPGPSNRGHVAGPRELLDQRSGQAQEFLLLCPCQSRHK